MSEPTRIYTPGEAADTLGVTTQSLRRYAQDYAGVFDEVPQHAGQRVFDDLIVERLTAAQALQQGNKAPSIRAALELVRDGSASGVLERLEQPSFEEAVLDRLERLTQAVERLQEENRVLHGALQALEPSTDKAESSDDDQKTAKLGEALRMNAYLKGELERRDAEAMKVKRPWWWRWLRG